MVRVLRRASTRCGPGCELMILRVLVVPDKFKGTLPAQQVARAISDGWAEARPQDVIESLPMSDGGEGFGQVLGELLSARRQECLSVDAAGRKRIASWWLDTRTHTAIIEAAEVNGIALLPPGRYHPFELDTTGLGALMTAAAGSTARRVYVGLGGSATNDGGYGLARALGWTFLDGQGRELRAWTELVRLAQIRQPCEPLQAPQEVIAAVDVANPLLGPSGATRVYGPQKGLRDVDLQHAEACLQRLADVSREAIGSTFEREPGSGAAGGLGFGVLAFAGGKFEMGSQLFARHAALETRIERADLVITAEGCFDEQSLMGKGVGMVAELAQRKGKTCLCLAGTVRVPPHAVPWPDCQAFSIVPTLTDQQRSQSQPAHWLSRLAARVAARAL